VRPGQVQRGPLRLDALPQQSGDPAPPAPHHIGGRVGVRRNLAYRYRYPVGTRYLICTVKRTVL
jgi:hypothetical protein